MSEDRRIIRVDPENVHTDITFVLDRSGSMGKIKSDVIGGFAEFLREQKEVEGRATFSLIMFDGKDQEDWYLNTVRGQDIQVVEPLTNKTFVPRGLTPLLDAVAKAIRETEARLDELPEDRKPHKIIFGILTDGEENDSRDIKREQLFELITGKRDAGWEFVFLGANQDAFAEAGGMGIGSNQTLAYAAQTGFVQHAMRGFSAGMSSYRTSGLGEAYSFTAEDRNIQSTSGDTFTQDQPDITLTDDSSNTVDVTLTNETAVESEDEDDSERQERRA